VLLSFVLILVPMFGITINNIKWVTSDVYLNELKLVANKLGIDRLSSGYFPGV
jgi:uncharacterized protein involved in cysteine biosynthesis